MQQSFGVCLVSCFVPVQPRDHPCSLTTNSGVRQHRDMPPISFTTNTVHITAVCVCVSSQFPPFSRSVVFFYTKHFNIPWSTLEGGTWTGFLQTCLEQVQPWFHRTSILFLRVWENCRYFCTNSRWTFGCFLSRRSMRSTHELSMRPQHNKL